MDPIDDGPMTDKAVIYRTGRHWAMVLGPLMVVFLGGLSLKSQGFSATVLTALGLFWGISSYTDIQRSELELTRKRVLINIGFPFRKTYDIPLNEIVSIDFYQPTLGSMLNFGRIIIVYGANKRCAFRFVTSPGEFVTSVRQQIGSINPAPTGD